VPRQSSGRTNTTTHACTHEMAAGHCRRREELPTRPFIHLLYYPGFGQRRSRCGRRAFRARGRFLTRWRRGGDIDEASRDRWRRDEASQVRRGIVFDQASQVRGGRRRGHDGVFNRFHRFRNTFRTFSKDAWMHARNGAVNGAICTLRPLTRLAIPYRIPPRVRPSGERAVSSSVLDWRHDVWRRTVRCIATRDKPPKPTGCILVLACGRQFGWR
jgi:hypothetical protein